MSPSDINVEASIAADILMIDCSLALLKASLSSEGLVSTSPVVRQWKDVAMAVRLTAKDVMASYSYKQETSSSRLEIRPGIFRVYFLIANLLQFQSYHVK